MKLYSRCVTKAGDVLMIITDTGQPVVGRKEIATLMFEKYIFKKEVRGER